MLFDHEIKRIQEENRVLANMLATLIKSSKKGTTVPIEEFEMDETNILLSKSDGLPIWYALFVNKSQDKNIGYKLLADLIDQFEKLYAEAQQKKIVANFFKHQEFADQVSEIIESRREQHTSAVIKEVYRIENKKNSIVTSTLE